MWADFKNNTEIPYVSDLKSLEKFDYSNDYKKEWFLSKPKKLTNFLENISSEIDNNIWLIWNEKNIWEIQKQINKEIDIVSKNDMIEDLKEHKRYQLALLELQSDIKNNKEIENNNIDKDLLKYSFWFNEKFLKNNKITYNEIMLKENQEIIFPKWSNLKERDFDVKWYIQIWEDRITIVDQEIYNLFFDKELVKLEKSEKYKLKDKEDWIYIEKVSKEEKDNSKKIVEKKEKHLNKLNMEKSEKRDKILKIVKKSFNDLAEIRKDIVDNDSLNTPLESWTMVVVSDFSPEAGREFTKEKERIFDEIFTELNEEEIISILKDIPKDYQSKFVGSFVWNPNIELTDLQLEKIKNMNIKTYWIVMDLKWIYNNRLNDK